MELILDIFWEKQKAYIEWKQVACAVILALLLAGLYKYAAGQQELEKKYLEQAALPGNLTVNDPLVHVLQEEKEKIYPAAGEKEENRYPDITAGEQNYGMSYGGTGDTEDSSGIKEAKADEKIRIGEVQKSDKSVGDGQKIAAVIPGMDAVTGDRGILSGREEEGSKDAEDEAAGPGAETGADAKAETDTETKTDTKTDTETNTGGAWEKPAVGIERFPGFLADAQGRITGYTDASKIMKDNLLVLPAHQACTGIEKDALKGLEAEVSEIYIPANIIYIAPGAFDGMANLYYIEAAEGNSAFYSREGILYHRNGKVAACPGRLK